MSWTDGSEARFFNVTQCHTLSLCQNVTHCHQHKMSGCHGPGPEGVVDCHWVMIIQCWVMTIHCSVLRILLLSFENILQIALRIHCSYSSCSMSKLQLLGSSAATFLIFRFCSHCHCHLPAVWDPDAGHYEPFEKVILLDTRSIPDPKLTNPTAPG